MKIYEVGSDYDNFDSCDINNEACRESFDIGHLAGWELDFNFDGSTQTKSWWPRIMERHNENSELGDKSPSIGRDVMILKKEAVDKLKPIMGNIEVLPLICDFGDYWAINVLDVLKCIDYDKSEFDLLSDELDEGCPRIMNFIKYEFIKEKIEGYNLFKIFDKRRSMICANEIFVDHVEKYGITGFEFDLIWQG